MSVEGAVSPRPQPLQRQSREKTNSVQKTGKVAPIPFTAQPMFTDGTPPTNHVDPMQPEEPSEKQLQAGGMMTPQRFLLDIDDAPRFTSHNNARDVSDAESEVEEIQHPEAVEVGDQSFGRFLLKEGEAGLGTDILSWVGLFDACKAARASFAIQQAVKGLAGRTQMIDISGYRNAAGWNSAQLIATVGRFCPHVSAFVNSEIGADVTFYGASLASNSPTISQLKYMDCARSLQFLTVCCTAEHLNRVLRNPREQLQNLKFLRMDAARLSIKECTELQAWTHVPHLTLSGTLWRNQALEKGVDLIHDRAQSFPRALSIGTVDNLQELRLEFKNWVEFESDWDRVSEMVRGLPCELTGIQLSFCDPESHSYQYMNQDEFSNDVDDWCDEFDEIQHEMCEKFAHLRCRGIIRSEIGGVNSTVVLAFGTAIGYWNWMSKREGGDQIEVFGEK